MRRMISTTAPITQIHTHSPLSLIKPGDGAEVRFET